MKRITAALTYIILFAYASTAQSFIKSLGKNINNQIECSCFDGEGNLTVGYYNFKDTIRDTLIFSKWNMVSKTWSLINKIPVKNPHKNFSKCIYKYDSLLVFAKLKRTGNINSGLVYINNAGYKSIGDFRGGKGDGYIIDLKNINNRIMIFGSFDSVRVNTNSSKAQHMTLYNGVGFEYMKTPTEFANSPISDFPVANILDTFLMIAGGNMVWQFVFPAKWTLIAKSTKPNFIGVAHNGNNWVIMRENADSLMFYNGKKIEYKVLKQKFSSPLTIVNTSQGLLLSEGGKIGRLFMYDPLKNFFTNIYHNFRNDTITRNILAFKTKIVYISSTPVIYRNFNFGKIVELSLPESMPVEYDTISVFVFNDNNNNIKYDAGDNMLQPSVIVNKTYGKILTSSTGIFKDIVPDYNDVSYEVKYLQRCSRVPAFVKVQTSNNTSQGVKHDSLYFPVQQNSLAKNIFIKSYAQKQKARLLDTIPLEININNNDCQLYKSKGTVTLTLDSNTTFVSSNPPFSSINKNVLKYDFTYTSEENPLKIKLNVIYSNLYYNIDDIVKHFVKIENDFAEDTSDNFDSITQKIVYSFDPNEKNCEPSGAVSGEVKTIRYFIEFQNEGTDEARRVTVVDTLDVHIPVYEFQMISCSHNYEVSLKNNVVTWVFDNINLPPKSITESGSKGFIIFEAHLNKNLATNDSVLNKAYIYFDYNTPIITNTASVMKKPDVVSPPDVEGKLSIRVYPNPASEVVVFENVSIKSQQVNVFNILGQEVSTFDIKASSFINKSIVDWPRGMYFVKSSNGGFQKFLVH